MAIVVDQATLGTNAITGTGNTVTLTTTQTVAAGAKICVHVAWFHGSNTLSSGSDNGPGLTWRVATQINNGSDHKGILEADAPAGMASGTVITATFSAVGTDGRMIGASSFTGVQTGAAEATSTNIVATWSSGNLTSAAAGSLYYGCSMNDGNTSASTPTAPAIECDDFNNATLNQGSTSAYRIEAASGTFTVAGAWAIGATPASVGAVFLAVAGAAGIQGIPDFQRNAFPLMPMAQRPIGIPLGNPYTARDLRFTSDQGPAPYGGFERFLFPRLHQVVGGVIFNQDLFADAVVATATLLKQPGKLLTATTVTSTASLVRQSGKLLAATVSSVASLVRRTGKFLTATTVTSTATLLAQKGIMLALTATVTSTATLVRQAGKPLSATSSSVATLVRQTGKKLTATTVTSVATLSATKGIIKLLVANVSSTATMVRQTGLHLSAAVTGTPTLVKQVGKKLTATTVSSVATLLSSKAFTKALTATVTSTATMTRQTGKALSASVSATASIVKRVGKNLTATVTSVASLLADAVIAGAVQVVSFFGIRPRGSTTGSPHSGEMGSMPRGQTAISPDEHDFDIDPKGRP